MSEEIIKKSIYISLPFTGHEDTLQERLSDALHYVDDVLNVINSEEENYKYVPVTQDDVLDVIAHNKAAFGAEYNHYMGKDIEKVLNCDAILMCDGWEESKGCNLEYQAALIYNKNIYYFEKELNDEYNSVLKEN